MPIGFDDCTTIEYSNKELFCAGGDTVDKEVVEERVMTRGLSTEGIEGIDVAVGCRFVKLLFKFFCLGLLEQRFTFVCLFFGFLLLIEVADFFMLLRALEAFF